MADSDFDDLHSKLLGKSCIWHDPGPRPRCPDCDGSGSIVLLVTKRPCVRCGGTGFIERPAPVAPHEYNSASVAAEEAAKEHAEPLPAAEFPPPARAESPAPATELPPPILSTYFYEKDTPFPVGEKRLSCEDGQWWEEQFVMVDGDWQLVSRAPIAPPPGMGPRQ